MVETLFVALFVVLPLVAALLFLLFRARIFLRNLLVVVLIAIGVWGTLKIADSDFGLFERRDRASGLYQPASCFSTEAVERLRQVDQGCAL